MDMMKILIVNILRILVDFTKMGEKFQDNANIVNIIIHMVNMVVQYVGIFMEKMRRMMRMSEEIRKKKIVDEFINDIVVELVIDTINDINSAINEYMYKAINKLKEIEDYYEFEEKFREIGTIYLGLTADLVNAHHDFVVRCEEVINNE